MKQLRKLCFSTSVLLLCLFLLAALPAAALVPHEEAPPADAAQTEEAPVPAQEPVIEAVLEPEPQTEELPPAGPPDDAGQAAGEPVPVQAPAPEAVLEAGLSSPDEAAGMAMGEAQPMEPLGADEAHDRDGDVVYTEAGLNEWLDENRWSGNTAVLGGDLVISGEVTVGTPIDAGDYRLLVGGTLALEDGAVITGSGANTAVVEVLSGGRLFIQQGSYTSMPVVAALSGCAICVQSGGNMAGALNSMLGIEANGDAGVGICASGDLDPQTALFINAAGSGGKGIVAGGGVCLKNSVITASAAAVEAAALHVDTCVLSPEAAAATRTHKKITRVIPPVPAWHFVGESIPDYEYEEWRCTIVFDDGSREISWMKPVPEDLDIIDTGVPGTSKVRMTLSEPHSLLNLVGNPMAAAIDMVITEGDTLPVFDCAQDMFYYIAVNWLFRVPYAQQEAVFEELTLWRSDNGGKTWFAVEKDSMMLDSGYLTYFVDPGEFPPEMWLAVERNGVGETKITKIKYEEGALLPIAGGDRDGGDAEGPTPPDVEQPGPANPGSGGTPPKGSGNPNSTGNPTQPPPPSVTGHDPARDSGSPNSSSQPVNAGISGAGTGSGGQTTTPAATPQAGAGILRTDAAASQSEPAATESLTSGSITVNGVRLAEMIRQQGALVLFQKQTISLLLDSAFLSGLRLGASDTLTVRLEAQGEETYLVEVLVNGVRQDSLPPSEVRVWHSMPGATGALVRDESGNMLSNVRYDASEGLVAFQIQSSGIFTILGAERGAAVANTPAADGSGGSPGTPSGYGLPLVLICALAVILCCVAALRFGITSRRRMTLHTKS